MGSDPSFTIILRTPHYSPPLNVSFSICDMLAPCPEVIQLGRVILKPLEVAIGKGCERPPWKGMAVLLRCAKENEEAKRSAFAF